MQPNPLSRGIVLCGLMAIGLCAYANGANMADPTRPPSELLQKSPAEDESVSSEPLRVQSVKIGKSSKFAVIEGTVVKEGDTFNQMKVVRIHHQGVELKGETGPVVLSLNPSVTKTDRKPSQKPVK